MKTITLALALSLLTPALASAQTVKPCAMVMAASSADAIYSWNAVHDGRAEEVNPLLSDAIQWRSRSAFVGVKLLLTLPVCVAIDQQKKPRDKWITASAAIALYTFLAIKAKRIK